jgi:nitrite reductase/ring-hydroxylating ferredoxin subunit
MSRKLLTTAIFLIVIAGLLAISACSQPSAAGAGNGNSNAAIKQTRINAQINGDTVTIPVSDLDKSINVNFKVKTATDYLAFMAYRYGGKTYVRADVCVPCGSESFTLNKNTLICDSCGTVFDAQTGKGLRGVKVCQGYPKQPVPFEIADGQIIMKGTDLAATFNNTLNPGKS